MRDYLNALITKNRNDINTIRPRPASVFEVPNPSVNIEEVNPELPSINKFQKKNTQNMSYMQPINPLVSQKSDIPVKDQYIKKESIFEGKKVISREKVLHNLKNEHHTLSNSNQQVNDDEDKIWSNVPPFQISQLPTQQNPSSITKRGTQSDMHSVTLSHDEKTEISLHSNSQPIPQIIENDKLSSPFHKAEHIRVKPELIENSDGEQNISPEISPSTRNIMISPVVNPVSSFLRPKTPESPGSSTEPNPGDSSPMIRVNIGRVVVQASTPPLMEKDRSNRVQWKPTITLDDYLSRFRGVG